ncbi:MAG: hypothetical protein V4662_18965 [Verrucomicrobiota bacterium]
MTCLRSTATGVDGWLFAHAAASAFNPSGRGDSIFASEHGIFEASRYFRHSDIRITSAIYADKK